MRDLMPETNPGVYLVADATEHDIALDLFEMLETAIDRGRLVGSNDTHAASVADHHKSPATLVLTLDNGQAFELRVREGRRA